MINTYTDEEKVEIAQKEYDGLLEKEKVRTNEGGKTVGYVSQINDKPSGEQSYVITPEYAPYSASQSARNQVQEVTVLYRGSTGLTKFFQEPADVTRDWLQTNAATAGQVFTGGENPPVMEQLRTSADSLKKVMDTYPNSKVYVYGHSLGSMNGQYALAALPKEYISRIGGGYLYQGPKKISLPEYSCLTNLGRSRPTSTGG